MSSVWDNPSGDSEWNKPDSHGEEKTTSDVWDSPGQANDSNNKETQADIWNNNNGNNENMDPISSEFEARTPAAAGEGGDFGCRVCGESGHFARQCPNAEARKCFNCDEPGHSKADCPNPAKPRACFNCGDEGHNKADCPKPRVFKGTCRICSKEGHPAAACPDKPADVCTNCRQEGHLARDCKNNHKFDRSHVADKLPEEAWAMMKKASDERDPDDFSEAIEIYTKAAPDATYVDIAKKMREEEFRIFLIALERDCGDIYTLIGLQGQLDRQYYVGYYLHETPMRANEESRWPRDAEENLERLANAGRIYPRGIIQCRTCGELGHGDRDCKQERKVIERVEIKCFNCNELGHRVRDCTKERRNTRACRNCGEDHETRECPEPRAGGANVECRRCGKVGHYAKECPNQAERAPRTCRNCGSEDHIARDCDQPFNPATMICRNCEQPGHHARDCPEPKDWSKVKCHRCGDMGHTVKRCRQPEEDTNNAPAETGEAASGQDFWGQDTDNAPAETGEAASGQDFWGQDTDNAPAETGEAASGQDKEVETVRQRLDDLW